MGLTVLALATAGCSDVDEPPSVRSYAHDYAQELTTVASVDTVRLRVGVDFWVPETVDTTRVFIDTASSPDDTLRLTLGIVGHSYGAHDRATVLAGWYGDTLSVWCGVMEPLPPVAGIVGVGEKTSYPPPWFAATRVDVTLPAGVALEYLGRWRQ
jgi:hypothetical protein